MLSVGVGHERFLSGRGDQTSRLVVHARDREGATRIAARAPGLDMQPLVGLDRLVQPDRMVQARDVELAVAGKVTLLGVKSMDARKLALSCSTAQFKFKGIKVCSERTQQSVATDRRGNAAPAER